MSQRAVLQNGSGVEVGTTSNPLIVNSNSRVVSKLLTFTGGTPHALGDHDGNNDPYVIFTVTGTVLASVFGICGTGITGSATIECGVVGSGQTATIIPQIVDAADLIADEIWTDATPTTFAEALPGKKIISGNIILTLGAANITAGTILMYCVWEPLSSGATVVAGTGSQGAI